MPTNKDILPGELVWVAGELWEEPSQFGALKQVMFTYAQLALVISRTTDDFILWFAEYGIDKKREHVLARAPMGSETTKVWVAS